MFGGMNSTLANRGLSILLFSQKFARTPPFCRTAPANRTRTMNPIPVFTATAFTPGPSSRTILANRRYRSTTSFGRPCR